MSSLTPTFRIQNSMIEQAVKDLLHKLFGTYPGDGTVPGAVSPNQAVVADASGNVAGFSNLGFVGHQFTAIAGNTPLTLTGAQQAGVNDVTINLTAALAGAGTLNSATAAQIVAAIPNAFVGQTYKLRIINSSSGAFAWTLTTATGVTLTGTMSIAQNTFRDFVVTLTSLTAVTIQQVGTGTTS